MSSFRDIQQDCEVIVKDLRECLKDHFRDPKVKIWFTLDNLVSEILKDKDPSHPPSWIFKKCIMSEVG